MNTDKMQNDEEMELTEIIAVGIYGVDKAEHKYFHQERMKSWSKLPAGWKKLYYDWASIIVKKILPILSARLEKELQESEPPKEAK